MKYTIKYSTGGANGKYAEKYKRTDKDMRQAVNKWKSDEQLAIKKYGHISSWDVSAVTDMSSMFIHDAAFNQDISSWNVSAVTDMRYMFSGATSFNQDIRSWDVSAVTEMSNMFLRATSFNQDIGLWVIQNNCEDIFMFSHSGVTRRTFLPNPPTNTVTNLEQYGTGRGIYGEKIANSFIPSLPNPKTNDELKEIRRRYQLM